jgi:hypothetical protein
MAGMLRFELRKSILETDGLPVSLRPYADQFLISNLQTTISDQESVRAKKNG